jgi:hypothetical protein
MEVSAQHPRNPVKPAAASSLQNPGEPASEADHFLRLNRSSQTPCRVESNHSLVCDFEMQVGELHPGPYLYRVELLADEHAIDASAWNSWSFSRNDIPALRGDPEFQKQGRTLNLQTFIDALLDATYRTEPLLVAREYLVLERR